LSAACFANAGVIVNTIIVNKPETKINNFFIFLFCLAQHSQWIYQKIVTMKINQLANKLKFCFQKAVNYFP
jgi:hypothetical protein